MRVWDAKKLSKNAPSVICAAFRSLVEYSNCTFEGALDEHICYNFYVSICDIDVICDIYVNKIIRIVFRCFMCYLFIIQNEQICL